MKKLSMLLLLAVVFTVLSGTQATADLKNTHLYLAENSKNCYINGSPKVLDGAPYIKNSRFMVPIRIISETLGLSVDYDGGTKAITIYDDKSVIKMVLDKKTYLVNGKSKTLDVAPEVVNGRTMVPIYVVSENMDAHIKYFGDTKSISIADIPNFHFKAAATNNWQFLLPEGWSASQGDKCELTVRGENIGYVFNRFWYNRPADDKYILKSLAEDYIKRVNGNVDTASVLMDTNIYSASFEYQGTEINGKAVLYSALIQVKPSGNAATYIVEFYPKDLEIQRDTMEKGYMSQLSITGKRDLNGQ